MSPRPENDLNICTFFGVFFYTILKRPPTIITKICLKTFLFKV